jgi:transcriptional regulator with XRE-family HTH domain
VITGAQMRAARALLRWSADELAAAARLGVATIRRAESVDGAPNSTEANLAAIRAALEAAGVIFLEDGDVAGGPGVALRGR